MYRFMGCVIFAGALLGGCRDADTVQQNDQELSESTPPGDLVADSENRTVDNGKQTVTANKVIEETREAARYAGELISDTKDEYVAKLSAKMEEYDQEIERLQERASSLTGEAKAEWNEEIDEMQLRREQLRILLEELKASTGDAWRDLQTSTSQLWGELKARLDGAEDKIDKMKSDTDAEDVDEVPVEQTPPATENGPTPPVDGAG
ncbi:MAG: hypothetical protein WEB58_06515 [Planctomycetaceae bacterium]